MKTLFDESNKELTELLSHFHNLTGMKICIYDVDGNEISYYPDRFTPFCGEMRKNEALERRCIACDNEAIRKCALREKAEIYTCHAGLTECIAPIMGGDGVSGYIAIGQIKEENFSLPTELMPFKGLVDDMPSVSRDKIESALQVIKALAEYGHLKQFLESTTKSFKVAFGDYITAHISEPLGICTLMKHFHLSRVELYRSVESAFGLTPAEYIKEKRLKFAYRLVTESDCPVSEIADRCGIGDYNYFSKQFKKKYGKSVREIRKASSSFFEKKLGKKL